MINNFFEFFSHKNQIAKEKLLANNLSCDSLFPYNVIKSHYSTEDTLTN